LLKAAESGDLAALSEQIERGVDVNAQNEARAAAWRATPSPPRALTRAARRWARRR
jgi:hypothetical protein